MAKKNTAIAVKDTSNASAEDQRAAFLVTVPKRLMNAQALALSLGVSANVRASDTGAVVSFYDSNSLIDSNLGFDCEEWELGYIENLLTSLKNTRDRRDQRLALATAAWARIDTADQPLIKEFIGYLKISK
jgi:hypothetical protein